MSMEQTDPFLLAHAGLRLAETSLHPYSGQPFDAVREALHNVAAALDALRKKEAAGREAERRLAVQLALLEDRMLQVEDRVLQVEKLEDRIHSLEIRLGEVLESRIWQSLRFAGGVALGLTGKSTGKPQRAATTAPNQVEEEAAEEKAAYARWISHEQSESPSAEQIEAAKRWPYQPLISILIAPSCRDKVRLAKVMGSVRNQAYTGWEVRAAFTELVEPWAAEMLQWDGADGRVQQAAELYTDVVDALNAAAKSASGDWLIFLDETHVLSPYALFYLVQALQDAPYDLVYWDEDRLDIEGYRVNPVFKPDWSPDLLTSCMYIGPSLAVNRRGFDEVGGFSAKNSGAHDHDLVLRMTDVSCRVHHIPRVLSHRATTEERSKADAASAQAIEDAILRREGTIASCEAGSAPGMFLVRRQVDQVAELTAIICSKRPDLLAVCLQSLRSTAARIGRIIVVIHEEGSVNPDLRRVAEEYGATALPYGGRFNYAVMNNLGAAAAETPYLLFLNDDVVATEQGWAEILAEQLARKEVGIAGAVLRYPSGAIQHAGIVLGITDGAGHVGRFQQSSNLWPWLSATRNVSAVTGACFAVRGELFRSLGGFNPAFPNNYNDVDFCIRARLAGSEIVCVPVSGLIHAESQTRRRGVRFEERNTFYSIWGHILSRTDPYYSKALEPTEKIALNLSGNRGYTALLAEDR